MSSFVEWFKRQGAEEQPKTQNAQPKALGAQPQQESKIESTNGFVDWFKKQTAPQSPSTRGGQRNESMVSSPYDVYGKKLFAKEGGLRYDLFTGESKPSQPLDKLTIGQVKALQRKRKDTAAGAYQFTLATLEDTQKEAGLSDNDLFDAKNQYRLFETFTRSNERHARSKLGYDRISDAQRYSLHFIGRYGGVDFLQKLRDNPTANFASLFPKAYARNKALFKNIGGEKATLADVFGELSNRMR